MSRNRTPQKKPAKPQSDTNRDRRARRGEKQAAPKPTPVPEPVSPAPVAADVAQRLPGFARDLAPTAEPPAVASPAPEADLAVTVPPPPTDQVVDDLLGQLGHPPALPDRAGLPEHPPAHGLSTPQWVRLQVTLELMGRGENAWRSAQEAVDCSDLLDKITRQILAFGESPSLQRTTFEGHA